MMQSMQVVDDMKPSAQSAVAASGSQRGFSLFELVVYLLVASILFAVVINRYREFPGEAERASFISIHAQLQAAVNLQMMNAIASGERAQLSDLVGSNPMDLMLQAPINYAGEFALVDPVTMPRRAWYFDSARGELVYLAENSSNLYLMRNGRAEPGREIRLRIENVYGNGGLNEWQGTILTAVEPYQWQRVPIELLAAEKAGEEMGRN